MLALGLAPDGGRVGQRFEIERTDDFVLQLECTRELTVCTGTFGKLDSTRGAGGSLRVIDWVAHRTPRRKDVRKFRIHPRVAGEEGRENGRLQQGGFVLQGDGVIVISLFC